jgi:alpha-D-xyloside xylohydrolase
MFNRRDIIKSIAAGIATAPAAGIAAPAKPQARSASPTWTQIHPGVWRARIGTPEAYTPVSARSISPAPLTSLPSVAAPPLPAITGRITHRGTELQLPLALNEELYGFGLQLLSFPQRGKKKTIRNNADPRLDTGDSHAPVPFYVSTLGYGVLVDTCRQAIFYCGDAHLRPAHAESPLGHSATSDAESAIAPPASRIDIEVPRSAGVDVYLFAGPSMLQAVQRYNLFSGSGVLPPEWGLGFWYRGDGHAHQEQIEGFAREFREHQIPCDVLGLEPGWQSHAYSCSFSWDKERFPDPSGMIRSLSEANFRTNLWEHAFTHPTSPLFDPLTPHSADYGVWGGLVPDFAGEPARRIFGDYHGTKLIDLGVAGFKLDECDGSDFTGGWSYPDQSTFPSGIDGEQMHSIFGLRYQDAIWKQFRDRNQPTFGLVRSSGALAAPYPFVLYSDLYGHRDFIRGIVNAGFSGLLWCPEVRDASSEEDLIRRLQSVIFSSLAMVNAWYIKNPPWKQIDRPKNNADELAPHWQALEARCREIIGWRMQLVPYLRAAYAKYADDGTPPFRALILDHPEEKDLRKIDDEYLIGDRMLVAPLFAGEAERRIVLPAGAWHDFWTGDPVAKTLTITASRRNIPVFVRAGSVLPLAEVGLHTGSPEARQLTVHIYGDGSLPFHLNAPEVHLTLSWNGNGQISQTGPKPYNVIAWKKMS